MESGGRGAGRAVVENMVGIEIVGDGVPLFTSSSLLGRGLTI